MRSTSRLILAVVILACGAAAKAGIEALSRSDRPALAQPLSTLPLALGEWLGRDVPVDERIIEQAQTDDFLNRVYESSTHRGVQLKLWINYSKKGDNMRHSPEICLPSGGWTKLESDCLVLEVERPGGAPVRLSRLAYKQGELVQGVGFWYYIFGEGQVEKFVRRLPITSRSSHGHTTRGSGMTVEVFCPGGSDPDAAALRDFVAALAVALDPILPADQAQYYVP
ncbi:MAG: EpsI family protein [Planctomycetota bacterium]|nr:EpsI family protein [Planctomycetota bacterium]